jgi:hypothetical protein
MLTFGLLLFGIVLFIMGCFGMESPFGLLLIFVGGLTIYTTIWG